MKLCFARTGVFLVPVLVFFSTTCCSQHPVKEFSANSFSREEFIAIKKATGVNKKIPQIYSKQICIALAYFPELLNVSIEFRVKHTYTPLQSRPSLLSIVKINPRRKYIITISDSSNKKLAPILFKNLPFNAQVGVIGHELSHIADFNSKSTFELLRIGLGNLSQKFLDRFEFRTDSICIAHGLGYQLLSWSIYVRNALHQQNWEGADNINDPVMERERYMNPGTIRKRINASALYQ